ncbi:MAG: hypothetical protein GY757_10095 [bacterium]|nr:hypothetical protein [bacterium]
MAKFKRKAGEDMLNTEEILKDFVTIKQFQEIAALRQHVEDWMWDAFSRMKRGKVKKEQVNYYEFLPNPVVVWKNHKGETIRTKLEIKSRVATFF